jgi:hypothetical protein
MSPRRRAAYEKELMFENIGYHLAAGNRREDQS